MENKNRLISYDVNDSGTIVLMGLKNEIVEFLDADTLEVITRYKSEDFINNIDLGFNDNFMAILGANKKFTFFKIPQLIVDKTLDEQIDILFSK